MRSGTDHCQLIEIFDSLRWRKTIKQKDKIKSNALSCLVDFTETHYQIKNPPKMTGSYIV